MSLEELAILFAYNITSFFYNLGYKEISHLFYLSV